MSEVELRWYMDANDEEGQFIGNLNYWHVFNVERSLWDRLKHVRKQLDYHVKASRDEDARGIEVLRDARNSLAEAHLMFRNMKSDMAKEFHEKTGTAYRDEQDS